RFSRDWSSDVCSSDLKKRKQETIGNPPAATGILRYRIVDRDLTILYRSVFTGRKKGLNPDTPGLPVLKDSILSGEAVLSFQPVGRDMIYEYNVADHIDSSTKEPAWGEMRYTTRSFKNI